MILDFWLMTAFASHMPCSPHSHPHDCIVAYLTSFASHCHSEKELLEESRINVGPQKYLSAFSCCSVNAESGCFIPQPRMTQRSHRNNSKGREVEVAVLWEQAWLMGVGRAEEVIEDSKLLVKLATVGNDTKILNLIHVDKAFSVHTLTENKGKYVYFAMR